MFSSLMKKNRLHQVRQGTGDLRAPRRHQRLERRQRDGEMTIAQSGATRSSGSALAPGVRPLRGRRPLDQRGLHGAVLRNAGAALAALTRGEFLAQLFDSAELFLTGFMLALIVGRPLGMLLARVRLLRIGIEPTS